MCTFSQSIKKGSRTHPTPLGIVRRRPPQFQIYYEKFGESPHLLMDPGLSTSPNHNIIFSLMFISSIVQIHKVNGDLCNNMPFRPLCQLHIQTYFTSFELEKHVRQISSPPIPYNASSTSHTLKNLKLT